MAQKNRTSRNWYNIKALADGHAEIVIYDEISYWGKSAADFIRELNALQGVSEITLRINSPGGDVFDGHAIYNLLRGHPATVTAHIDGIAASIASIIAMAADEIVMPANAMMMIHDPSGGAIGHADELRKAADVLDKLRAALVAAYVARSGADEATVEQWMADETWFTAAEAVEAGLADTVIEPVKAAASFDLSQFANVPQALAPHLGAPAARNTRNKGGQSMDIEQLKAQLKQAGDQNTALQNKLDDATDKLEQARARLEQAQPMIEAGQAYQNRLIDEVVAARRTLGLVKDSDEEVKAAREFLASWPLRQLEAEARHLTDLAARPTGSGITPPAIDDDDSGAKPTTFRAKKED